MNNTGITYIELEFWVEREKTTALEREDWWKCEYVLIPVHYVYGPPCYITHGV